MCMEGQETEEQLLGNGCTQRLDGPRNTRGDTGTEKVFIGEELRGGCYS